MCLYWLHKKYEGVIVVRYSFKENGYQQKCYLWWAVHVGAASCSRYEGETSKSEVMHKDIDPLLVSNVWLVPELQADNNTQIHHAPEDSVEHKIILLHVNERNARSKHKKDMGMKTWHLMHFLLVLDSSTFWEAESFQEKDKWMRAILEEMESLNKNKTWELALAS